jgi:branched-chain amino acid transport system substrate-binding protein
MKQHRQRILGVVFFLLFNFPGTYVFAEPEQINIAVNIPLSGGLALVGTGAKNVTEMAKNEIDAAGGIKIGGKVYTLNFIYGDNASNKSVGTALVIDQISKQQALAVIGPYSSDRAIPLGEVANSFRTPMITPWSTAPLTTLNRSFVFRIAYVYSVEAMATTRFSAKEWKADKAAVLYDELNPYSSGVAKSFKESFESTNGSGSVVAFETNRTGETNFSRQLQVILNSGADFLYLPQHDGEVSLIVQEAKKKGWKKPITGSTSWGGGDLVGRCGADCKGLYYTANFAPGGATGATKTFVDNYQKAYNKLPDEPTSLTYDAVQLLVQSLKKMGGLSGDLFQDRKSLRDQIAITKNFEGVTGTLSYKGSGDPERCATIVKIDDTGQLVVHDKICP